MKIRELLDGIRKKDFVLPEFQREYVWTREQAKQLFVSLAKDYPVGGLLFWKTDKPPELKNIQQLPEKLGTIQVILDGQQRLTTLFMLIEGEIPPYYKKIDIQTDPRDLYYNIETGEFQYYQASRMRGNPTWLPVTQCFQDNRHRDTSAPGGPPIPDVHHFRPQLQVQLVPVPGPRHGCIILHQDRDRGSRGRYPRMGECRHRSRLRPRGPGPRYRHIFGPDHGLERGELLQGDKRISEDQRLFPRDHTSRDT